MAIRNIAKRGEEILTKKCKPVKEINDRVRTLCWDMIDTMIDADGVGLAAPQVGVMKRIFVARPYLDDEDADKTEGDEIVVMINPEVIYQEGEKDCVEGCLSVPGYVGVVSRPTRIKIKALDIDGIERTYEMEDFAANVVSHELDHLEGIVYADKAKSMMTSEEYEKMMEEREERKKSSKSKSEETGATE